MKSLMPANVCWWNATTRCPGFTAWRVHLEQPTKEELETELDHIEREIEKEHQMNDECGRDRLTWLKKTTTC